MPRNDFQKLTRRTVVPGEYLGKKVNPTALAEVVANPDQRRTVKIDVSATYFRKSGDTRHSLWIGSYPNDNVPMGVIVADSKGLPKRPGAMVRKGKRGDGSNQLGYARVGVDVGDLICISEASTLSPTVTLLRIIRFTEAHDHVAKAVCEPLITTVFGADGDVRAFTYDTDGIFLNKIGTSVVEDLTTVARDLMFREDCQWYEMYISHLAAVPKDHRGTVDYSTMTQVTHDVTPDQFFDDLRRFGIHFYRSLRKDIESESPVFVHENVNFYRSRVPLTLVYTVVPEEAGEEITTAKAVSLIAQIPFCDSLYVEITPENFNQFLNEHFMVLFAEDFHALAERILTQSRGNGTITEERTLSI